VSRRLLQKSFSAACEALFDSPKILCFAFVILCALPTVFFTASNLSIQQLEDQAQQDAITISQHIGERIGIINTVLASMVGLQDVTSDVDHDKLLQFFDDILKNARYIKNLGRYEQLTHEQRESFESLMSHNGYSGFSISQFNDNEKFGVRTAQDTYYPISIAGPLHATVPGLIGTDLASLPGFNEAFENVGSGENSNIITLSDNWPLDGDLMAIRPVATFGSLSTTIVSHGEVGLGKTAGGFWLTLDIENLFHELADVVSQFHVSIEFVNGINRTSIYSARGVEDQSLYLSWLYPANSFKEVWKVSATTSLVITLEQSVGLSLLTLVFSIVALLMTVLIAIMFSMHLAGKKQIEKERHEGLEKLLKARENAEKTLNSVPDAIITLDPAMLIVHINPAAAIFFNTRASLAIGQHIKSLTQFNHASENNALLNINSELISLGQNSKKEFDVTPVGTADEDFVLRMSLSSSHDHHDKVTGHVIVLRDISHARRLTRKLAYQANYDALTGCTNRHHFEKTMEHLVELMPSTGNTHTLCYMDLDQFKVVNDTCGHSAGDQLLKELTKSLQLMVRAQDTLSRLGGDEFGLIIVEVDEVEATAIAERIFEFFQHYIFTHQGNTFSVKASIGIVHMNSLCANSKDIMAAADIACYEAKDSGRNSMTIYCKDSMSERSVALNWLPRLQSALRNNEFRLYAQAVATLQPLNGEQPIAHFEFLLRLADKDGTEITPWQFIQAAERYDLMREIDRWVIGNALECMARYSTGVAGNCSFSINLSGQSAADPTMKSFIKDQLAQHEVDPTRVWFELTETAAISHFSVAIDLIKSIQSNGAKVALDDFGSGLSSFGYLKNLPIDILKIDGQFVKEIAKNPIDREMVAAIHRVGESMNIKTVAEFVEDQAIVDELVRIGVHYAQGFHIGRPVPVEEAITLLENQAKAA